MRSFVPIVVIFLSGAASAQDLRPRPFDVDATIVRGLAFLANDAIVWKSEHNCVSCHHAGLVIWSMREAKLRGHAVDEPVLAELTKWVAESGDGKTGVARPAGIPKAINTKALNFALALSAFPDPDPVSQKGMILLLRTLQADQNENGSWSAWPETRPPIFGNSDESMTTLATLAMMSAAAMGDDSAKAVRDRGIRWLAETKSDNDPQSIAMRLVLWRRLGRAAEEWKPLVQQIKGRQNTDGGWSQSDAMPGDAWATGQALYALAHAGIKPNEPVIARAHVFACPRLDARQGANPAPNPQSGQSGAEPGRGKTVAGSQKGAGGDSRRKTRVRLRSNGAPASARVGITGSDGKSHGPAAAAIRMTKRNEPYFYAENFFDLELPPGPVRMNVSGGLETIPQTITVDADAPVELTVQMQRWVDMAARGWYSGDSHVHLHTGGPIDVTVADALVAARAEGVNYVNLCASNSAGDDIRDAEMITGKPHAASTESQLLVFGEEMRSTIYGHMQFFGINRLVQPQYTGFDGTPNRNDFPANHVMAADAVRQGGLVTYGHPMFAAEPFPFGSDLAKASGAARELPIDAILGVVHAIDLMSYNSDENLSAELWYRLLNCGLKLSACVGTDAILDRSTEPLGGDRVYVKIDGPLTMQRWLDGLKSGRSLVTNGPIPTFEVNGKGPGEICELSKAGNVRIAVTVESYVPFSKIEVIANGKVVAHDDAAGDSPGLRVRRLDVELPIERSSWIALRVRGPESPNVFDGPAWAHTSPVFVTIAGQRITSTQDAKYFIDWIEQMLKVVDARNRFASVENRRQVELLFRRAQMEFRKLVDAG